MSDWRTVLDAENALLGAQGAEERLGVAFSGGGIRSATFCLGVLQYLTRRGWLKEVDYLSTVSGGGYIGAWLTALVHRVPANPLAGLPAPQTNRIIRDEVLGAGSASLRWIRRYSNYLTPRSGFTADTLSTVGLILSNIVLSLAISVLLVGALALLALTLGLAATALADLLAGNSRGQGQFLLFWGSCALFFVGSVALAPTVMRLMDKYRDVATPVRVTMAMPSLWLAAGCAVVSFFGLALLASIAARGALDWSAILPAARGLHPLVAAGLAYGMFHAIGTLPTSALTWQELAKPEAGFWGKGGQPAWRRALTVATEVGMAAIAGAVGGAVFVLLSGWISAAEPYPWTALMLGAPVALVLCLAAFSTHVMLFNRGLPPELREWWHRVFAWLLGAALAWVGAFAALAMGPALFSKGTVGWASATIAAWIGSTAFGTVVALGKTVGARVESRTRGWLTSIAAAVFAVVLVLLVCAGATRLVIGAMGGLICDSLGDCLDASVAALGVAASAAGTTDAAALAATAVLVLWVVDRLYNVNWHSLYQLYRSRLVRCFLGASNRERVHNASGFDPADDITLSSADQRPYPLLCCTLNLVGSRDLAWQTRKAASFVFSPRFAGFVLPKATPDGADVEAFAPAASYMSGASRDGAASGDQKPWHTHATLGSAMTISGAAASPSCGYHTRAFMAFLMGVFNIRLGRWCPNPARPDRWSEVDPMFGVAWFVRELLGWTTEKSDFVYLSDGGHFDNLGLYELVRRRCRRIVAVDAEHDPQWKFDGLSEAVRKCRLDLDTEIEIDPAVVRPQPGERHSPRSSAIGTVHYPDGKKGCLLYLKLSLPLHGSTAADAEGYAAAHPDFPHQSTADQWFDETQFEAYRELGQAVAAQALRDCTEPDLGCCIDCLCSGGASAPPPGD